MVDVYQIAMGQERRDTLVIIATEVGRAAAINGTARTGHGTSGMMYMLGGAANGGPIMSIGQA